jgi:hypothetical protein
VGFLARRPIRRSTGRSRADLAERALFDALASAGRGTIDWRLEATVSTRNGEFVGEHRTDPHGARVPTGSIPGWSSNIPEPQPRREVPTERLYDAIDELDMAVRESRENSAMESR